MVVSDTLAVVDTRRLGLACVASGVLMALLCIPLGVAIGDVPATQWSYPHPPGMFLAEGVALAVAHLLSAAGFVGALRLGAVGHGRSGRWGLQLAVAGLVGLSVAEVASGLIGAQSVDSTAAGLVGTAFGVTSLVFAVGAVVAGVAVLRAGVWPGPGRWAVLATGVVIVVLVTPANAVGDLTSRQVALLVWSLLFIPLGLDVARGLGGRRGGRVG